MAADHVVADHAMAGHVMACRVGAQVSIGPVLQRTPAAAEALFCVVLPSFGFKLSALLTDVFLAV